MADPIGGASPQWQGVDELVAAKILEQGEMYLKAQLDIALASDRRAMTVGSIFVTISTGALAAAIGFFHQHHTVPVLVTGIVAAAWMGTASYYSFLACWPSAFEIVGNHPKQWWPHVALPLKVLIGKETENYQTRIANNNDRLETSADRLRRGARFALTAPAAAFIAWCVSLYFFPL